VVLASLLHCGESHKLYVTFTLMDSVLQAWTFLSLYFIKYKWPYMVDLCVAWSIFWENSMSFIHWHNAHRWSRMYFTELFYLNKSHSSHLANLNSISMVRGVLWVSEGWDSLAFFASNWFY
jgi:hypothetical protein